jgi:hypothetical protein
LQRARAVPLLAGAGLLLALTAAAAARATTPAPPPLVTFAGLDASQLPGANPSDTQVASGPGWVVEAVNTSIAMWSTAGATPDERKRERYEAFFGTPGHDMTDPRVLYDTRSGRFFTLIVDLTTASIRLGVSATGDPTGDWHLSTITTNSCPDQPRLGMSDTLVVVTDDAFNECTERAEFVGAEATLLSKQDMLAGAANPARTQLGPDSEFASITPVTSLGPTSTEYMVSTELNGLGIDLFEIGSLQVSSLTFAFVPLAAPLDQPHRAAQAGGTRELIDTGDPRTQNAVWEGGRIWMTATDACAQISLSCARAIELTAPGGGVVFDSRVGLASQRSLFYPAVAPDPFGNAALVFSFSSASDFPGAGYTYLRPDGAVAPVALITPGTAANTSERFGDYSGIARDPADPSRFWLAGEIGADAAGTPAGLGWGTAVAAVRLPAQPPAVLPARAQAGARSATFAAELYPEATAATYRFEYGPTAAYGSTTASAGLPGSLRSQVVSATAGGLSPGVTYHFRLVATNAIGPTDGPDQTVTVPAERPAATYPARSVVRGRRKATLRALVVPNGAATSIAFQFGRTRRYGRTLHARTLDGEAGSTLVSVRVPRLQRGRVYHFRVIATNGRGRTVAADRRFRL